MVTLGCIYTGLSIAGGARGLGRADAPNLGDGTAGCTAGIPTCPPIFEVVLEVMVFGCVSNILPL